MASTLEELIFDVWGSAIQHVGTVREIPGEPVQVLIGDTVTLMRQNHWPEFWIAWNLRAIAAYYKRYKVSPAVIHILTALELAAEEINPHELANI